jgi:hypothetical protein
MGAMIPWQVNWVRGLESLDWVRGLRKSSIAFVTAKPIFFPIANSRIPGEAKRASRCHRSLSHWA